METHHPALYVMAIAVAAALFVEIPPRLRLPSAVFEIVLGFAIGPHGLGVLPLDGLLHWLGTAGIAALFFMAGLELDLGRVRGRPIRLAMRGWFVSLVLGLIAGFLLYRDGLIGAPILTGLALTTTSLDTVLGVLRDAGRLRTQFGLLVSAAGAAGEFGPVICISLAFTHGASEWHQVALLLTLVFTAIFAAIVALRARPPRVLQAIRKTMHSSTQLPVRLSVLLVTLFAVLSERLGFEVIIGAFAAGMIVGLASRGREAEPLHEKMDGICFGFLGPFFFVTAGMKLDFASLFGGGYTWLFVPAFVLLFLIVRGIPASLYRFDIQPGDRLPFALFSASALSTVIAVTQIGIETGRMPSSEAAALSCAALVSALMFPALASARLSASVPAGDQAA